MLKVEQSFGVLISSNILGHRAEEYSKKLVLQYFYFRVHAKVFMSLNFSTFLNFTSSYKDVTWRMAWSATTIM